MSRLRRNHTLDRWGGQDLNLRPTDYESVNDRSVSSRHVPLPAVSFRLETPELPTSGNDSPQVRPITLAANCFRDQPTRLRLA
jgi:hypothetical protein